METRLTNIEARLDYIESELAIHNLIVKYGLAVDCNDLETASACHSPEAEYIVSAPRAGQDDLVLSGHQALRDMLSSDLHQSLLPNCAHTVGPITMTIGNPSTYSGAEDSAKALGYSRVYHMGVLMRIAVNQWQFRRYENNWLIQQRVSRIVGSEDAQLLLRSALNSN